MQPERGARGTDTRGAQENTDFPIGADREPTAEEERVADEQELDEGVAEHYEEMIKRGAAVKGEGEI